MAFEQRHDGWHLLRACRIERGAPVDVRDIHIGTQIQRQLYGFEDERTARSTGIQAVPPPIPNAAINAVVRSLRRA